MSLVTVDTIHSLNNVENYKPKLVDTATIVIEKYVTILCEYFNLITKSDDINPSSIIQFVIVRGIQTITHIFNIIMYYCKNVDLAYHHCQNGFLFYVEFVGQITDDKNTFLQLGSRDAIFFVYKKTIYEINQEYRANMVRVLDDAEKEKYEKIETMTKVFQKIACDFIGKIDYIKNEKPKEELNTLCELIFTVMKMINKESVSLKKIKEYNEKLIDNEELVNEKTVSGFYEKVLNLLE